MNTKIRDTIFFLIVLSLIFNTIPKLVQMNLLGGPVSNKLVFYPLLAGFIYTIYVHYRKERIIEFPKIFSSYVLVYFIVSMISLTLGLINYPYWDLVLSGPIQQIERLSKIIPLLEAHGIYCDYKLLMSNWIIVRQIKILLLEIFWCFGGAYIVFLWYKDSWQQGIKIACKGLLCSLCIFIAYGFLDVLYLHNNIYAKNLLIVLNPYIHPIKTQNGWWPPLLWKGQLRSVFVEPSHIGNYLSLVFPFLIYAYLKYKSRLYLFLLPTVVFLAVLSKARTAYAMLVGMICLFLLLIVIMARRYWKQAVAIILVSLFGFYGGVIFINNVGKSNKINIEVENIIDDNLKSLATSNKRSNGARYALIKCNLRIARKNPVFGVGNGLTLAYMLDNYTDEEKNNREVADWINRSHKYGIFAAGQGYGDAMNEFVTRLASRGIVGVILFLLPFLSLIYKLYKINVKEILLEKMALIMAVISSLIAGCNGSINLIYGIWIILGLGYAMCFGKKKDKEFNEPA